MEQLIVDLTKALSSGQWTAAVAGGLTLLLYVLRHIWPEVRPTIVPAWVAYVVAGLGAGATQALLVLQQEPPQSLMVILGTSLAMACFAVLGVYGGLKTPTVRALRRGTKA